MQIYAAIFFFFFKAASQTEIVFLQYSFLYGKHLFGLAAEARSQITDYITE